MRLAPQAKIFAFIFLFFAAKIFATIPANLGFSVIDGGSSANTNSAMNNAIFNLNLPTLLLEMGAVSYYDAPIFNSSEQLLTFFCGALLRVRQSRFSLSLASFNAFDLYQLTKLSASWAISALQILHFGIKADYLSHRSLGDRILGANTEFALGLGNRIFMATLLYSVQNIGDNRYNPIIQEIRTVFRLTENRLGAQAVILKIDNFNRRISAELAYSVNIHEQVSFGLSFIPRPFVINMGLTFAIRQTQTLAAFSVHNALGRTLHLGLQYRVE